MCGISGIVNGTVKEMLQKQEHRGPDDCGEYTWSNVQFGHNRLSIIDLSDNGHEPMYNNRYVLTYNGEIYNYKTMQAYLEVNDDLGDTTMQGNDAVMLLNYINKFGIEKALDVANGMFAFALYDNKTHTILLAVDRFAQKPLYYTIVGDKFAFASSPQALLHLRDKWQIDELALASYWKLGSVIYDSIWNGIYKVNASELVTYNLDSKKITTSRYWKPRYCQDTSDIQDVIIDAIDNVKVSDVPIYIFLSGGIDSSVVASRFANGNAIHLNGPELDYARQVAQKFNLDLKVVTPREYDAVQSMDDYCLKSGEPSMAALIPYITAAEVSKFAKVAISANGADELFFGYDRTDQSITEVQFDHIFRKCIDCPVWRSDIDERLSTGRWLELMTYIQCDLNKTLDFASMAHSLEVRSPFLDHRLVEMALSIPKEKIGRKKILKDILQDLGFEKSFINRPKMGFSLYQKPKDYDKLQSSAYDWCKKEGYLKVYGDVSKRDEMYLKASAFGFQRWWETWRDKIK